MTNKVVCFPITKWHLYGMLAYLNELYGEEEVQKLDISVYAVKHGENGYLLTSGDIPYKNILFHQEDELIIKKRNVLLFSGTLKKDKSPQVTLMFAKNILVRKMLAYLDETGTLMDKVQVILVDDGIGSYLSSKVWEKCSEAEGGVNFKSKIKNIIANLVKYSIKANEWHMLSVENGNLKRLHTEGYLKVIKHDVKKNFEQQLKDFKENYKGKRIAFFVTQPWSETGQISSIVEKKIITEVIAQLSKNYNVIMKPHPRENRQKYDNNGAVVLGREYPAEFYLCALEKDDIVIGFNSTALVSAAFIFNLQTYTISNRVISKNIKNMMNIACGEFLKLTKNSIKVLKKTN